MNRTALRALYVICLIGWGLINILAGLVFLFLVLAMPFEWVWMKWRIARERTSHRSWA
jgi:hypothetical protein